ncbi:MAG: tyrosine-type recombinase/integrase [Lachnospiraceae bacterium]|nr:tyrosine-type recombinase/integrase [Lachnospiraceae bacterium]
MAKKKKKNTLPSGSYRIQVLDYKDVDGKRHYKSFTAPTKAEAQLLAAQWKNNRTEEEKPKLTVYESVKRYIEIKENVLSPSTLAGYKRMHKNYFNNAFGRTDLDELKNKDIQIWIGDLASRLSPKTVRNINGLFQASIELFLPDFRFATTLPARIKPELYCPSDNDIKALIDSIRGTELEIAVLLAAFGPLRRGEICALTDKDIHGNTVSVSKSMVLGPDREWVVKQPKTFGSYRDVEFPDFVTSKLSGIKGRIVTASPDNVSERFRRALEAAGLPHFRFHDLRHYAASIMHAIGVPDQYILQRGGWSSDNIMKTIYRNTIDLEKVRQTKKINKHFKRFSV